ncbi:MAG: hypothetical protein P4K78_10700 [Terracidiphilus sp.]|nr:hypothetical protein [Terracidiphilus sp.]
MAAMAGVPGMVTDDAQIGNSGDDLKGIPLSELSPEGKVEVVAAFLGQELRLAFDFIFDGIGRWRNRDCYKLTDDAAAKLSDAWARFANEQWSKSRGGAPEWLRQLIERFPGLAGALISIWAVTMPMVLQDVAITRMQEGKLPGRPMAVEPKDGAKKPDIKEPVASAWQVPDKEGV